MTYIVYMDMNTKSLILKNLDSMDSAIHASHIFNILTCNSYTEYISLTVVDIYQSISDHI
jgi:hypothetical protein